MGGGGGGGGNAVKRPYVEEGICRTNMNEHGGRGGVQNLKFRAKILVE